MSCLIRESSSREEEKQMAEKTYKTLSSSGRIHKALKQVEYAIVHDKVGFIGFLILLAIIILSLISPFVFPVDVESDPSMILQGPSREHILGTDHLGRDIWAQIANGGRELLFLSCVTALLGMLIGVILGAFSAVIGGKFDEIMLFLADVWLSIPRFPLLVVFSGFFTLNNATLSIVLAVLSWAGIFRTVRSQVLSIKERDYIEVAFMQDLSLPHIVIKEILPNMMGFLAVNFTLLMRSTIYSQVGLVFLGLLPLEQNWGVMINLAWTQGVIYNPRTIMYLLAPTIMICLLILSLVWIGKALEDVFDPSLRK